MIIREAIRSDKPFRRKGDVYWKFVAEDRTIRMDYGRRPVIALDADDILANDWEIKE